MPILRSRSRMPDLSWPLLPTPAIIIVMKAIRLHDGWWIGLGISGSCSTTCLEPGVSEECSSHHSACALFITGLLIAHMFLKSIWTKIGLSIVTVSIAMFTNAIRIVTRFRSTPDPSV